MDWQIVEESSFERAVAALGGSRKIDEALAPIMNAIEGNPYVFDEVPGGNGVRLARTTIQIKDLNLIPSMWLWFRVSAAYHTISLLYVEYAPPEDMGYGGDIGL